MGVMMLHRHQRQTEARGELAGGTGAVGVRMQVVGDNLGPHIEQIEQAANGLVEKAAGLRGFQIADVRRDKRLGIARDANGILEMRAEGQHRRPATRQTDRAG